MVSLVATTKDPNASHTEKRKGYGEAAKENPIVSSNGGQGLMEFCSYSDKASTFKPVIYSV